MNSKLLLLTSKKYWKDHPMPSCIPSDIIDVQPLTPLRKEVYGLELKYNFKKEVKFKNE